MNEPQLRCLPLHLRSESGNLTEFPKLEPHHDPLIGYFFTYYLRNLQTYNPIVRRAFDFWQAILGIPFYQTGTVPKPATGQFATQIALHWYRNGNRNLPQRFTNGVLAYAYFPDGKSLGIHSDVYMNSAIYWRTAVSPGSYQPLLVLMHEIGHSLGLDHQTIERGLMNPFYDHNNTQLAPITLKKVLERYKEFLEKIEETPGCKCPCCELEINCEEDEQSENQSA